MKTFLLSLLAAAVLVGGVFVLVPLLEQGKVNARPDEDAQLRAFDASRVVVDPHLRRPVVEDELLVNLATDVTAEAFEAWLQKQGWPDVRVVGRIPRVGVLQLRVSPARRHAVRAAIDAEPMVASAGLNRVWHALRTFDDPALGPGKSEDWGLDRIGMPTAWERTTGGAVVGVIDDGLYVQHEEVQGKVLSPYSYATQSERMQHQRISSAPGDYVCTHGTHVAVTIAGTANNGVGTAGVAPDSPVVPVQVLYAAGPGQRPSGSDAEVIAGMERAIDSGAVVLNMSLGGSIHPDAHHAFQYGTPEQRAAIDRHFTETARDGLRSYVNVLALARERRAIIVVAAGNDSLPARWDSLCLSERVIGVAAIDDQDQRSRFGTAPYPSDPDRPLRMGSRYGPGATVSAPGSQIYSATADPSAPYDALDGTSMAAPHVAGVVALLKAVKSDLTFEEARDILVSTGTRLRTDHPIGPLVNAAAALRELDSRIERGVLPPPPEPPLEPGPPLPDPFEDGDVPGDLPGDLPPPTPEPSDPIVDEEVPVQPAPPEEVLDPVEPPEDVLDPGRPPGTEQPPTDPPAPPSYEDVLKGPRPWDDPRVRAKIDEWLQRATPPPGGRYNEWGIGVDNPYVNVKPNYKPDWAPQKYEFLWNNAREWKSQNLGTLYEYLHGLPLSKTVERPEASAQPPRPELPEQPPANPTPGGTQPLPSKPPTTMSPTVATDARALWKIVLELCHQGRHSEVVRDHHGWTAKEQDHYRFQMASSLSKAHIRSAFETFQRYGMRNADDVKLARPTHIRLAELVYLFPRGIKAQSGKPRVQRLISLQEPAGWYVLHIIHRAKEGLRHTYWYARPGDGRWSLTFPEGPTKPTLSEMQRGAGGDKPPVPESSTPGPNPEPVAPRWVLSDRQVTREAESDSKKTSSVNKYWTYEHGPNGSAYEQKTLKHGWQAGSKEDVLYAHWSHRITWTPMPKELRMGQPFQMRADLSFRQHFGTKSSGRNITVTSSGATVKTLSYSGPKVGGRVRAAVYRGAEKATVTMSITPRSERTKQITITVSTNGYTVRYVYTKS